MASLDPPPGVGPPPGPDRRVRTDPPLGFNGRLLRVDLSSGSLGEQPFAGDEARLYPGGALLGTRLLLQETAPGLDAFDPAGLLVFASSVVAGHRAPGLARFVVVGKSPLTRGVGETRAEGPFGVALKASGYDALVIRGRAAVPQVLVIRDGHASLVPADDLWGLETGPATDALSAAYPGASIAVIGPAGERLVRFASVVTDRSFAAPRMGLGAVMGAKQLKAIALLDGSVPPVAHPDALAALAARFAATVDVNPVTRWQRTVPGFGVWLAGAPPGSHVVENYRTTVFDGGGFAPDLLALSMAWGEGGCPGCPSDCIKGFVADPGDEAGVAAARMRVGANRDAGPHREALALARADRAGGLHQETLAALGPNLGIGRAAPVLALNGRCLDLGLDPVSLGFVLSFAMECAEAGLLPSDDPLVGDIRFGAERAAAELTEAIGARTGLGWLLGEGVKRASAELGPSTESFALQVKGLELATFDPRTQTNLALGYATAPIGPRYDVVEHDADFDDVRPSWPHAFEQARTLGVLQPMPQAGSGPGKVRAFRALHAFWSALDALAICPFASAPVRIWSVQQLTDLVAAVTGWETSGWELMRWGERRIQLLRIYDLREGLTAADDGLPERFFTLAVDAGPHAGARLDRDAFATSIAQLYAAMGWDEAGVPTVTTRWDHHLEWTLTPDGA